MTVRKTKAITMPKSPIECDALEFAQSRMGSREGAHLRHQVEKSESNKMIVEHFQQTTMELPDAPLVWQAIRDAEAGFPVEAAQILAQTFDFKTCDSHRMGEKIAKHVWEHTDGSFLGKFYDQLDFVCDYIARVVLPAVGEEVVEQEELFYIWGIQCVVIVCGVIYQMNILLDAWKEHCI